MRTLARQHLAGIVLVALVALATGFVLAGQVRAQVLTPSNQVARYQALARNVQELEATNADARREIASPRAQIDALESEAATRSSATPALKNQVCDLRADTGLVATHGPGVKINLRNGVPGPVTGSRAGVAIARGPGRAVYGVDSDVVIRSVVTEKPFVYAVASYLRPTSPPSSAPPRSDRVVR